MQLVVAEVPIEMFKYAIDLRSMTPSQGSFSMEFVRYEEVPQIISDKVVAVLKKKKIKLKHVQTLHMLLNNYKI